MVNDFSFMPVKSSQSKLFIVTVQYNLKNNWHNYMIERVKKIFNKQI